MALAVQVCMLRNWCMKNFSPAKAFLRPAAYDCGSLETCYCSSSVATSEYTSSSEEGSPRPAALEDFKDGSWTPFRHR